MLTLEYGMPSRRDNRVSTRGRNNSQQAEDVTEVGSRWTPGRDARYKKSEICQTCSKLKNVCQVCLLDLVYGLPVQVRDTTLSINSNDAIPKSDVNREYFVEEHDRRARAGLDYESSYGKAQPNDTILKLQRTTPYNKRNEHIFAVSSSEGPSKHIRVNDPVALKLLNKAGPKRAPRIDGEGASDEARHGVAHGGLLPRAVVSHQQNQFQPPGTSAGQDHVQVAMKKDEYLVRKYGLFIRVQDSIGAPVSWPSSLVWAGIGLDVVNYRTQQGEKTRILNDIVEFTEEDIRCRILNLPHHLYKSEILPLVVEGEKTR
ncbi:zinc finger CCCH domain-containing protein 49-like protein [Tanacetum coccineum]